MQLELESPDARCVSVSGGTPWIFPGTQMGALYASNTIWTRNDYFREVTSIIKMWTIAFEWMKTLTEACICKYIITSWHKRKSSQNITKEYRFYQRPVTRGSATNTHSRSVSILYNLWNLLPLKQSTFSLPYIRSHYWRWCLVYLPHMMHSHVNCSGHCVVELAPTYLCS